MILDRRGSSWKHTFEEISPLYAHLYECIEQDPDLLALLTPIDTHHPVPLVFFSTVNALVLRERPQPLAEFYPFLHRPARAAAEAWPYFRAFCLEHQNELRRRLPTARMQTNEVTRCANLMPAFELVYQRSGQPLALIEIGASAGLNLAWDRYNYHYHCDQDVIRYGGSSPLDLHCEIEGTSQHRPLFPRGALPPVSWRVGIDISPLDVTNESDALLLASYIWPEEFSRYQILTDAIAFARTDPPDIRAGDACTLLPELLASRTAANEALCVYHSYAIPRNVEALSAPIVAILAMASQERDIYRISLETDPERRQRPRLELLLYRGGKSISLEHLANCALHGESMEWLT